MTDYINRKDTIKAIESETYRHDYLDHVIDIIEDIPSADVAPVRHGRWEKNDDYTCSLCGYRMVIGDGAYHYCPNCGARMDEEVKE